ncbi:MAG: hypothetical protein ACK5JT_12200, partial [Hyphomicrobiaceae bacterium]
MHRQYRSDVAAADGSGNEGWPLWQTIAAFMAGFVLMTWPWLSGRVAIPWDAKATFLPQVQFLAQSLARGEAPWWNPFIFSGLPQIADPQSMIFSPPFFLLALVNRDPGPWAGDLTVLATMQLAGIGLILWFRDREWHWAGALLAALAFVFGAAMSWRIQHWGQVLSMCYLPWILFFLDRAIDRRSWVNGICAGVIAAFLVLGRDQVALMAVYLLIGWVIWQWCTAPSPWKAFRGSIGPLTAAGIIGLALVALPILMTIVLAAESNRPSIDYASAGAGSLHPALLATMVIPQVFSAASGVMGEFWGPPSFTWQGTGLYTAQNVGQSYIGALPLLLILIGTGTGRLWHRDIRYFSFAFLLTVVYALGWYTPFFRVAHAWLPGVDLYRRPADAVFMIGGLGAILAGYVLHTIFVEPWNRPGRKAFVLVAIALAAAYVVAIISAMAFGRLHQVITPLVLATASLGTAALALWWAAPRIALIPTCVGLLLAGVTAGDLAFNNGPNSSSALQPETFAVLETMSTKHPLALLKSLVVDNDTRRHRIELVGRGFHWPNASITHR